MIPPAFPPTLRFYLTSFIVAFISVNNGCSGFAVLPRARPFGVSMFSFRLLFLSFLSSSAFRLIENEMRARAPLFTHATAAFFAASVFRWLRLSFS